RRVCPVGAGTTDNLNWQLDSEGRRQQAWISRRNAPMDRLSSRFSCRLGNFAEKLRGSKKAKSDYGGKPWNPERDEPVFSPLVAMDFTGNGGRIIDDPREAEAVAAAEVRGWKRTLPRFTSSQRLDQSAVLPAGVQALPWFYGALPRETATQLLLRHAAEDGTFLVRRSLTRPATFVLSYLFRGKVHHVQILSLGGDVPCFSIDSGRTKFTNLPQLVEFYQLNQGQLLTRLGRHL
ncbi:unnamed protein product, partial [Ixodes hexagonus]